MSGCDFLPSLPGIGIKRAHAQLKKTRCFVKAVQTLRWAGTAVPPEYLERFQRALWVFRHQRVYCAQSRRVRPLQELPAGGLAAGAAVPSAAPGDGDLDFLGPHLDDDLGCKIAHGAWGGIIYLAGRQAVRCARQGCTDDPFFRSQYLAT